MKLKKKIKLALQSLLNVFVVFTTVFYLKFNFILEIDQKYFFFKKLGIIFFNLWQPFF